MSFGGFKEEWIVCYQLRPAVRMAAVGFGRLVVLCKWCIRNLYWNHPPLDFVQWWAFSRLQLYSYTLLDSISGQLRDSFRRERGLKLWLSYSLYFHFLQKTKKNSAFFAQKQKKTKNIFILIFQLLHTDFKCNFQFKMEFNSKMLWHQILRLNYVLQTR